LDEGFILDKRIGVGQPKRIENAKILVANTGGAGGRGDG
jgi:T-complex protein 1 subunit beta